MKLELVLILSQKSINYSGEIMRSKIAITIIIFLFTIVYTQAQIGTRFPSEKKVVIDPVTGVKLTFLTSTPAGDSKIYQTHNQWTSDGEWLIFRSDRVPGEAMAVNEKSGVIVQVTEGGYRGMLNVARKSMKLFYMQPSKDRAKDVIEVDLAALFTDSESGNLKPESRYKRICGTIPAEYGARGDMTLDADEEWVWFRVGKKKAREYLPKGIIIEENFGPRHMGAGPGGIAGMNVYTGELKYVISVPFQTGHIQSNPWVPGKVLA